MYLFVSFTTVPLEIAARVTVDTMERNGRKRIINGTTKVLDPLQDCELGFYVVKTSELIE